MTLKNKKSKNPPVLSQEYLIQNQADLVSFIPALLLGGLIFQVTRPLCSKFVAIQHGNTTLTPNGNVTSYSTGCYDFCGVFFYSTIMIVLHALVQEQLLDRAIRRLHLSKVKNAKFNESGQLLWFYLFSFFWSVYIMLQEEYFAKLSNFWELYPFASVNLQTKAFFIMQIAYWVHALPELYLQKSKKEDLSSKISFISINLGFILVPYLLNLGRIAIALLSLHYLCESVYHFVRLVYFAERNFLARWGFRLCNVLYILTRLVTIGFSILVFWFGLEKSSLPAVNYATGDFNTKLIRFNCLFAVIVSQVFLIYSFLSAHLRRLRERQQMLAQRRAAASKRRLEKQEQRTKAGSSKESAEDSGAEISDANEEQPVRSDADQVRKRAPVAKK